jgi:hypothetical protein
VNVEQEDELTRLAEMAGRERDAAAADSAAAVARRERRRESDAAIATTVQGAQQLQWHFHAALHSTGISE